ncbi:MAG: VTT domain-containing protein [Candidatus Aenigmarchaeota archaeon]|nr:VTT domain-containing protein [Candidatus Aenigmarchaeota archaeon]MDW8149095.1 VTT domain-containing protein [Candidatus Aenigmarchaeota archaeon]
MKSIYAILFFLLIGVSFSISISRESLYELIGYLGYVGVFILSLISSSSILLPAPFYLPLITIAAIKGLNPFVTILLASIGSTIGEITSYLIGAGITAIKKWKLEKLKDLFNKYGELLIVLFSFLPFFDVVGILSGTTKYNLKRFIFFTFVGKVLKMALIYYSSLYGFKLIID